MAALPPIDYQQLAQTLLANVAAAGGAAGAGAGGGAAPAAASTAEHYGGDHTDIERVGSSMKKFLPENCVDRGSSTRIPSPRMDPAERPTDPRRRD